MQGRGAGGEVMLTAPDFKFVTRRYVWLGHRIGTHPITHTPVWTPTHVRRRDTSKYSPRECARRGKR